ncbi:MAG: DUF4330 family protein, partial [Candidatus Hydrogenedentes bacterium]|nr:DUF4330 family protein [Candidatus Hydrogenedentota bacterium]
MPLLDKNGRILGKLNLFDLFLVVVVAAVVVLAYQRLTVGYRVAPPYALESQQVVVSVDLQLPREQTWICDVATPEAEETDPRSGDARARILGCVLEDGVPVVSLRIFAVRDGAARILFKGSPLLPGRSLRLETDIVILEGVV